MNIKDHLIKSYECAEMMFDCRQDFCPDTQAFYSASFFNRRINCTVISIKCQRLSPDGYAFPVREDTSWEYLMRIAYVLSFLHGRGVRYVHMFGSCKPEIIIVGAAAIGLEMFQRITFDSSTWDTARHNPPKYLGTKYLKTERHSQIKCFQTNASKSLNPKIEGL